MVLQLTNGNSEQTSTTLQHSLDAAHKIDDGSPRAYALGTLVSALLKAGDFKRALEVIFKMENTDETQAYNLAEIAEVLAATGKIGQALDVAQKISVADAKSYALYRIAIMFATDLVPKDENDSPYAPDERRMKKTFTPAENQLAKQIVEATEEN